MTEVECAETGNATSRHTVDLEILDDCIEAGWAWERELIRKQLRLRTFLLNAMAYREALAAIGQKMEAPK